MSSPAIDFSDLGGKRVDPGRIDFSDIGGRPVLAEPTHPSMFASRDPMSMPGAKRPTGAMPGSFEGHPENVGEYVPATAGRVTEGAVDIGRGNVSMGAHKIIQGGMNVLAPTAPFFAAAAPVATAATLGIGTLGQMGAQKGAAALGATPDQAALAGDVGGLAAGAGTAKLAGMVPSFDRAGAHFNSIESQYGSRPVNTTNAAMKVGELVDRMNLTKRSPVPPIFNEFLERATSANNPLTFAEARKFYTDMNSLVYDREFPSQYHGAMKKAVGVLGDDVTNSLPTQRSRDWFNATKKEWSRAERISQNAQNIGEPIGAALGGMAGYEAGGGLAGTGLGSVAGGVAGRMVGRPVIGSMVDAVLNRPAPPPPSFAGTAARTAAIMDMAKNGEISPGEADRRIRLLGESTKIKRPTSPQ